ncbi:MAG: ATP-binding protein [Oligoflexia bacterium]|nr:ATP-binding protein [Oligoflexia bacterium]
MPSLELFHTARTHDFFGFQRPWVRPALVALAYFIAAESGWSLFRATGGPIQFWPASGMAMASLLLWGWRLWPAVLLGALSFSWYHGVGDLIGDGIFLVRGARGAEAQLRSLISVAEALLFYWLLNGKDSAYTLPLKVRKHIGVSLLGAGVAGGLGSLVGYALLLAIQGESATFLVRDWLAWWSADALGILIVAPVVLTWGFSPARSWQQGLVLALAGAVLIGMSDRTSGAQPWQPLFVAFLSITGLLLASSVRAEAELARLAEQLSNERVRIDDLVASIPGMVWEKWVDPTSPEARRDFVSDYSTQLVGYAPEAWLSDKKLWVKLLHPEDRRKKFREIRDCFESGQGGTHQFRWIARDGREVWIECRSRAILDSKGKPIGMRGVNVEITARKQVENSLHRAIRVREDTLATVSHDLRNPLVAIKLNAGVLPLLSDRPSLLKATGRIFLAAEQMERLINDLLDAARIDAGKFTVALRSVPVSRLLEEAQELLEGLAREKNITLSIQGRELSLQCDPGRILQVLSNVIGNAIKFSPSGTEVRAEVTERGGMARFSVQDHGPGIKPDCVPKLFDRYWQGNKAAKACLKGVGLGLFITRQIVEAHGGQIWVESGPDGGSCFIFTVPTDACKAQSRTG